MGQFILYSLKPQFGERFEVIRNIKYTRISSNPPFFYFIPLIQRGGIIVFHADSSKCD